MIRLASALIEKQPYTWRRDTEFVASSNVELVREVYDAWARGDFSGSLDLYDEAITYTTFAAEGDELVLHGLEAVVRWNRQFFSQWRNFRVEARELFDRGEKVLVIGHQHAEGKGSGAPIDMPVFAVWTFRGGRVIELLITRHREKALEAAAA
jgi:ketosteroid isomerase-like protein